MSTRIEELKRLKEKINIEVKNSDNIPKDRPSIIIANHSCLMDIFYLTASSPTRIVPISFANSSVEFISS